MEICLQEVSWAVLSGLRPVGYRKERKYGHREKLGCSAVTTMASQPVPGEPCSWDASSELYWVRSRELDIYNTPWTNCWMLATRGRGVTLGKAASYFQLSIIPGEGWELRASAGSIPAAGHKSFILKGASEHRMLYYVIIPLLFQFNYFEDFISLNRCQWTFQLLYSLYLEVFFSWENLFQINCLCPRFCIMLLF